MCTPRTTILIRVPLPSPAKDHTFCCVNVQDGPFSEYTPLHRRHHGDRACIHIVPRLVEVTSRMQILQDEINS